MRKKIEERLSEMSEVVLKFKVECSVGGAPGFDMPREEGLRISMKWPDTDWIYADMELQGKYWRRRNPEANRNATKDELDTYRDEATVGDAVTPFDGTNYLGWDTPDVAEAMADVFASMTVKKGDRKRPKDRAIPESHAGDLNVTYENMPPGQSTGMLIIRNAEHVDIAVSNPKLRFWVALVDYRKPRPGGRASGSGPLTDVEDKSPPKKEGSSKTPTFQPENAGTLPIVNGKKRRRPEGKGSDDAPPGQRMGGNPLKPGSIENWVNKKEGRRKKMPLLVSRRGVEIHRDGGVWLSVGEWPPGLRRHGMQSRATSYQLGVIRLWVDEGEVRRKWWSTEMDAVEVVFAYEHESRGAQVEEWLRCLKAAGVTAEREGFGVVIQGLEGSSGTLLGVEVQIGLGSGSRDVSFPWSIALDNVGRVHGGLGEQRVRRMIGAQVGRNETGSAGTSPAWTEA